MITDTTGEKFDKEVLKSTQPVFVCFTASQCDTCFPLCLVVKGLAEEYRGRVKFVKIDADREPELVERYKIMLVPSVLLFKGAKPVSKLLGFHYERPIRRWLNKLTEGT
jgi:thioredoxin 1